MQVKVVSKIALLVLSVAMVSGVALGSRGTAPVAGSARVIDGDTLQMGDERVRLEGIDAPESGQRCGRKWFGTWDCGAAASRELQTLIGSARVTCESMGQDKYRRMLGRCFVGDVDINREMVRRGMAWAFVKYSTSYVADEAIARERRTGIWQGDADPAWVWRDRQWQQHATAAPNGCAIKGNVTKSGRIYHMPWSPWYGKVRMDKGDGERWFCSEAEALAAGWRPVATLR